MSNPGPGDARPESSPDRAAVLARKARLLFADGRRAAAMQAAREAVGFARGQPALMRALAGVLRDCQQVEQAQEWLQQALDDAPDDPAILYDLAMTGYHLNQADAAEAHVNITHTYATKRWYLAVLAIVSSLRCEHR